MLTEEEAKKLMVKLIDLRSKAHNDKNALHQLKIHENLCFTKFKYLVTMKTNKYKTFSNYDDLNQEGFIALMKAMSNYNPNKGSFFFWAHKYINTRISRSANLHTTIRFPLKIAKSSIPHKETIMPIIIEKNNCPDKELEQNQIKLLINSVLISLNDQQKEIISLYYGLNKETPLSINKICLKLNITRSCCIKIINSAFHVMKRHIKL